MAPESASNLPADPFALHPAQAFEAAERRELRVYGQSVELLYLPGRAKRQGIPGPQKAPFRPCPMRRILAEEALWQGQGVTITANPFPFAERQLLLWSQDPVREVGREMLEMALLMEERCRGAVMLNSTGAAASISRAHLHLIGDCGGFLPKLPSEAVDPAYLQEDPELECRPCSAPFPSFIHVLLGPARSRARAAHRLLQLRSTAAINLISTVGKTFVVPRSSVEIPIPYFPHALGSSELFGRWCYADQDAFAEATGEDLEKALAICCVPRA